MKQFLLLLVFLSQSVLADLDQAIAYAEAGDVEAGQMELVNIARRAMEGDPQSMCEFGEMYAKEGYWIVQSDKDASDWWLKSAETGYVPCQLSIGAAYLIGFGIEKDLSKARFWLQKTIDSYDEFHSEVAETLYAIHELDKY
jgi:TPR repeat protein